ncbi:MAG: M20/M25/M40 family metallo-hydrolase [Candidatus Nanopelagicales bacterium]
MSDSTIDAAPAEVAGQPDLATLQARLAEIMPELTADLLELSAIPSVATDGFPVEPVKAAADLLVAQLRKAGITDIEEFKLEGKIGPAVFAKVPGPAGAPTVLLYTHYDVVPEGDLDEWSSAPFTPVVRDGSVVGRGTADSKANVVSIIGALRILECQPPVNVVFVCEGQEEFGSPFDFYPSKEPERFAADAMIIADVGSVRPGVPTLTLGLRGSTSVTVSARTLQTDKHSGAFGGAAPDARVALIRALATLHDENGDVAVAGLRRDPWTGANYEDAEFAELAQILPGVPLQGTGTIGERIWSGPALTVIAFDAPSTSAPQNAVAASASAVLNLRVHPAQDAKEAQDALVAHLNNLKPFGIALEVTPGEYGNGFQAENSGIAFDAASAAVSQAWGGAPTVTMSAGGSIPIVMDLAVAVPTAEIQMFGAIDGRANMHGPNERVLLSEFENATLAHALFLQHYAALKK